MFSRKTDTVFYFFISFLIYILPLKKLENFFIEKETFNFLKEKYFILIFKYLKQVRVLT